MPERAPHAALFAEFGDAVGRLHGIGLHHFAGRAAAWDRDGGILTASGASAIAPAVAPALTHRDRYLTTALVADGHLAALLDFAVAQGYGPLLDLGKTGIFMFERSPEARAPSPTAYRRRPGPVV